MRPVAAGDGRSRPPHVAGSVSPERPRSRGLTAKARISLEFYAIVVPRVDGDKSSIFFGDVFLSARFRRRFKNACPGPHGFNAR